MDVFDYIRRVFTREPSVTHHPQVQPMGAKREPHPGAPPSQTPAGSSVPDRLQIRASEVKSLAQKEIRKTYYDSGELRSEVGYKDGKEEGRAVVYYRGGDGKIEMEMHYKDGELDGMYKKYDRAGKLRYECNYRGGALQGSARHFDQAGIIMDETDFTNGQKGRTREYDENGRLVS